MARYKKKIVHHWYTGPNRSKKTLKHITIAKKTHHNRTIQSESQQIDRPNSASSANGEAMRTSRSSKGPSSRSDFGVEPSSRNRQPIRIRQTVFRRRRRAVPGSTVVSIRRQVAGLLHLLLLDLLVAMEDFLIGASFSFPPLDEAYWSWGRGYGEDLSRSSICSVFLVGFAN